MSTILLMSDLRAVRLRKIDELEFYAAQLRELNLKMSVLKQEVELTTKIIELIDREVLKTGPVWARVKGAA